MNRLWTLHFLLLFLLFLPTGESGCLDRPIGLQDAGMFPNVRFTASSYYQTTSGNKPYRARLTSSQAWAPTSETDPNDYLQVDLGSLYVICGLGTKGNRQTSKNEWTTEYKINTSLDGATWVSYKDSGAEKLFRGNSDSTTLVTNTLAISTNMRFVRFIPTLYNRFKALRIELFGFRQDCTQPLGMENQGILSTAMTSSSEIDGSHSASAGRLYGGSSWCSATLSSSEYLQVDLGRVVRVTGIATQGSPDEYKWASRYRLSYSNDSNTWSTVTSDFAGNVDGNGVRVNWLSPQIRSRFIKVHAQSWNTAVCMRLEIHGCERNPLSCDIPVGVADGTIPDANLTASSTSNSSALVSTARLNYAAGPSWCAGSDDFSPFFEVDLGTIHVICAVATQGSADSEDWIQSYRLAGAQDGLTWKKYTEDGKVKVFDGNFDSSTTVKQFLRNALVARHVRFILEKRKGSACMRVEIYGRSTSECAKVGVGMRLGGRLPDHRLYATTEHNEYLKAHEGRLYGPFGWATYGNNDLNDHIRIDLGGIHIICAIATQGSHTSAEWVTKYKVAYSIDGQTWSLYQENGANKTFLANTDQDSVVTNVLQSPVAVKMLRIYPVEYSGYKCMRLEVYGYKQDFHSSLMIERFLVRKDPTSILSSSGSTDVSHDASKALLYGASSWCVPDLTNQFIQLDLGVMTTISGIATQGGDNKWATFYHVKLKCDNSSRSITLSGFQGNMDANTVVTRWLSSPVEARYVTVTPTSASSGGGTCLRLDVFGTKALAGTTYIESVMVSNNLTVPSQISAVVTCTVYGPPNLQVEWHRGITNLTESSNMSIYGNGFRNSTITINFTNPADFTIDGCVRNYSGDGKALCSKQVTCMAYARSEVASGPTYKQTRVYIELDPPHKPQSFNTTGITDTTAAFSWVQPVSSGELPVDYFLIEYYVTANPAGRLSETDGSGSRSKVIAGLLANTSYTAEIRAIHRFGRGFPSTVNFKTVPTIPCERRGLGMEKRAIPDLYITSSTQNDISTPPSEGRLNLQGGSWCASPSDVTPFLQVDLGTRHVICAVATQGSPTADQWAVSYQLQFADDENFWFYMEANVVRTFSGNADRSSKVKNLLLGNPEATTVRFLPRQWHGLIACMRVEVYGSLASPACADVPVGLDSESLVMDHRFTSSSSLREAYRPWKARMSSGTAWAPNGNSNDNDYLQVDLGSVFTVCYVETRGNKDSSTSEWTGSYRLDVSLDNRVWKFVKTFQGNTDHNAPVKNKLPIPSPARFVRFQPTSFNNYKVLRVDLYGVIHECQQALGIENKGIRDEQMTTSSKQDDSHGASAGRLYAGSSWCSATSSSSEYLQVDLGRVAKVTGIATQGSPTEDKWVMTYALSHSNNGEDWVEYKAGQNILKTLAGNSDGSRVAVNWLQYPFMSRHVRVTPQTWRNAICLRVDFYGCAVTCDKHPVGLANLEVPDSNITASSVLNITTPPSQGRLNSLGGSWCANTTDTAPYLQVDLGTRHVICAVSTQGSPSADQWVQSYEVHGSLDGVTWVPYKERVRVKVFQGNFDSQSVVKQDLSEVLVARFVRMLPVTHHTAACLRAEIYGAAVEDCSKEPVGVHFGGEVQDSHMTATSQYAGNYQAWRGRLYNPLYAWAASTKTGAGDYLEVDLGAVFLLAGIATQGHPSENEFTRSYKLLMSLGGQQWETYKENNTNKIFNGNTDKTTVVKRTFSMVTAARYVRVNPMTFQGYKQMRVELYGCRQGWRVPVGVETGQVSDVRMSSSSYSSPNHNASAARLYASTWWCASSSLPTEFLQVDLGLLVDVTGVALQSGDTASRVTQFDLELGCTNSIWRILKGLTGNSAANTVMTTWLDDPIGARLVRIRPTAHESGVCMRIEIYVNKQVPPPHIISLSMNGNLTASANATTRLFCNYTLPHASVRWILNNKLIPQPAGSPVTYPDGYSVSNVTVWFTSADEIVDKCDEGVGSSRDRRCSAKVTCQVFYRNLVTRGAVERSVPVYIQLMVPSSPENVTAVNVFDSSATIKWLQPPATTAEGEVRHFVIQYSADSSAVFKDIAGAKFRSRILKGLRANTTYSVQIRAVSIVGEGNLANFTFKTNPTIPCHRKSVGLETKAIPDSFITASSQKNFTTPPSRGRLNLVAGAWCASPSDVIPYLQVDLGLRHVICAVATQGSPSADHWVRSFQLHFTYDAITWRPYISRDLIIVEFKGNTDRLSEKYHRLNDSIVARVVRILVTSYQTSPCMRVELFGKPSLPGCADVPVGLQSRTRILDHRFTATSHFSDRYLPYFGRLRFKKCWAPKTNNGPDYLQVDLGSLYRICGVATQGSPINDEWTTKYQLSFSRDNVAWFDFYENSIIKTFDGNTNRNEIVRHQLSSAVYARFVRVIPTAYRGHKIVRMELYGVLQECNEPLGLEDKGVVNEKMTSSSKLNDSYSASAGRLYGGSSWCSATSSQAEYLQVDLGRVTRVTGIATQGSPTEDKWVTLYSVEQSDDGHFFTEYTAGESSKKVFTGNIDGSGVVVNWLMYPMTARYYRIKPEEWNAAICLRFDLYGCRVSCDHLPLRPSATLSSSQNTSMTPPSLGKLHFPTGSWCAAPSDVTPYLQVDLGSRHVICAVATQGSPTADHWVQTYKIQASLDGSSWRNYSESKNEMLFGNSDRSSVTKHVFIEAIETRYLRLVVMKSLGLACMRFELYGIAREVCEAEAVGVRAGGVIRSDHFTATSVYDNSIGYAASMGRLHGSLGWTPATATDNTDHLQVDLGSVYALCGVATQGAKEDNEWVTSYSIKTSMNGLNWQRYSENNIGKNFTGNSDQNTVKKHSFAHMTSVRFIRFYPDTYHTMKQMRVELYGVPQGPWRPLGIENGRIPDDQMLASFHTDNKHNATHGRLYAESAWCNNASASSNLDIDLGQTRTVTGVATQGLGSEPSWLPAKYELWFSFTGDEYNPYPVSFQGNTLPSRVRVNWFLKPIGARYVRFRPVTTSNKACVRLEVYGSEGVASPEITNLTLSGNLTTTAGSRAVVTCTARGEPLIAIQWFIFDKVFEGNDSNTKGTMASSRMIRYTSAEQVHNSYECANTGMRSRRMRCHALVTCNAYYKIPISAGADRRNTVVFIDLNLPSVPTELNVTYTRSTSLNMTWAAPEPGDGSIRNYTVRYSVADNTSHVTVAHIPRASKQTAQLTRLKVFARYTISVQALSSIGPGWWSNELNIRTYLPASVSVLKQRYILRLGLTGVRLRCNGQGFPLPKMSWSKDGSAVAPDRYQNTEVSETNISSVFELSSGTTYADAGNYTCHAVNNVDDKGAVSAVIQVLFEPEFTRHPRSQTIKQGNHVAFGCAASGRPQPRITWLYNGSDALPQGSHQLSNGSLNVAAVYNNGSYEGLYTCLASSEAGMAQSNASLIVDVPPSVLSLRGNSTVILEQTINLTCLVRGDPTPAVYWKKDGQIITTATLSENNRTLTTQAFRVADEGRYACFATNRAGNDSKSILITVTECQQALGIENKGIRDEQMTTSSKQDDSHGASAGRLYAGSSWCSATSSSSEYLQVDLGRVTKITGIATQGSPTEDKWVMTYALSHSNNGEDWVEYKAGQKILKTLVGNSDGSRVAVNWLQYPFMSRHVRVTPQTWRNAICLRVDFYGCAGEKYLQTFKYSSIADFSFYNSS
ncbi:uncharacterized protein LOC5501433 isoform X1 [Nematostella vectensis]|nr:uncharacterized protein LOC5501433 isoform X1 [Nematostella vectensis]